MPGADWQYAIRQGIREGDYFIACFSAEYVGRPLTYMSTEIGLAIEMLQQMPIDRIWFIPVLLSQCEVPDLPIGGGRTLSGLHREALYKDWEGGVRRILKAMGVERAQVKPAPSKPAKPVEVPAEQVTSVSASAGRRLQTEYGELQRRYDNLTLHIGAVDTLSLIHI